MVVAVVVVEAALEEAGLEEVEEEEVEEEDGLVVRVVEVEEGILDSLVPKVEMGLVGEVEREVTEVDRVKVDVEVKVDVP